MRILTLVLVFSLLGQLNGKLHAQELGAPGVTYSNEKNPIGTASNTDAFYPYKDPVWFLSIGWNIVDDDGSELSRFSDLFDNWNITPYPSRVAVGREFGNGLGIMAVGAYNRYTEGTIIDSSPIATTTEYFSLDGFVIYDMNEAFGETGFWDPYAGAGLGVSHVNNRTSTTGNFMIGSRFWLSDKWGIDLSSTAKFALELQTSNHLQHSFGVIFRWGDKKSNIPVETTTEVAGAVYSAETDQVIINNEVVIEPVVTEASVPTPEVLSLPYERIHFAFDSSRLESESLGRLRALASFAKDHQGVTLVLRAHTDTRGSSAYNQLLSERRLKSVLTFLSSEGIETSDWDVRAMGEDLPLISCETCSKSQHAMNRRVDFRIE